MQPKQLTLYVSTPNARSEPLLGRVRRVCEELGPEQVSLEVVDVVADPERARTDGVRVTPTLLAGTPHEGARAFGDLADVREALWGLGVGA